MKTLKQFALLSIMALASVFTACQEEEISSLDRTTRPPQGAPDDFAPESGGLPFPTIIEDIYISDVSGFSHTLCHAYRIEWPTM